MSKTQRSTAPLVLEAIADSALLLRLGDDISRATSERATRVAATLRAATLAGVVDVVPGYASVTVVLAEDTRTRLDDIAARVHRIAVRADIEAARDADVASNAHTDELSARSVEIPVVYGGERGIDLDELARQLGLGADEVVARHTAPEYVVAMVGFLPGFPYLLGLDPALAAPRRATPRARVPAGSVGIGGAQTGVYPVDSPGGWHLIGHTSTRLFDANRATPSLLQAGDRVTFRAVRA